MAEEGTQVWVSSELFALNDMLDSDKENHKNGVEPDLGSALCFPSEFPYESDFFSETSALASPGESVQDSNETESSDEEDFLAGLTRRLSQSSIRETRNLPLRSYVCERTEETLDLAHSPQSTLSRMGSWSARSAVSSDGSLNSSSQVTSPTSTPFVVKNDNWDVIHAVAGQVTRLKIAAERPLKYDYQNRKVFSASKGATSVIAANNPNNALYPAHTLGQILHQSSQIMQFNKQVREDQILKQRCSSVWASQAKLSWLAQQQQQILNGGQSGGYQSCHCSRSTCLPHEAALPQHQPSRYSRSAIVGVPATVAKRECSGTGVFLPRQYGKNTEPRKNTSCSPVVLPNNRFVHTPNIVVTKQPRLTAGYYTEHDATMARRNAVLLQQRRTWGLEGPANQQVPLPKEWTY